MKIGCQGSGSNGPAITIHLTNVGSKRLVIMASDAFVIVDLTVVDESGKLVVPERGWGGSEYILFDWVVQPGQSLDLTKYAGPDAPRLAFIPIADWGYRNLGSGTYMITAAATEPSVPAWSSGCIITVK